MNFIDDSSNAIASCDPEALQKYINDFFLVLEIFYNLSVLTLNRDKTKLIFTSKVCYRKQYEHITLTASKYTITQVNKIKVLGIYISYILDNQANITNIIQQILHSMRKYSLAHMVPT